MIIKKLSNLVYIPEWNENKKEPKDKQVQIRYRYLTGPERENLISLQPLKFNSKGEAVDEFTFEINQKEIVQICTLKIENLSLKDEDGTLQEVTNVESVIKEPELAGLYKELSDFYLNSNSAINKKKLK